MECGDQKSILDKLKLLILDCNGKAALSIEPSGTMNFNTVTPLDCLDQDISIESLFNLLLNNDGTAIKTVTGALSCDSFCDCDCPDWLSIARMIIVRGDDGEIYLRVGECSEECTDFFDCENQEIDLESIFKLMVSDSPLLKIVDCNSECDDLFECGDTESFEDVIRLLICEEGVRTTTCRTAPR